MINILYLSISICVLALTIFFIIFEVDRQRKKTQIFCIKKYDSYIVMLEYFCKKAYSIIYKDKIMIYSMEAMKVDESEYNMIAKQFSALVLKFMGLTLVKEFSEFFGDDTTLIFNIMEDFNNRYENDEIRETSTKDLMESELEVSKTINEVIR